MSQDESKKIAALEAEIATLKNIISIMPGNVFWRDCDGNNLGCNNNMAKILKLNNAKDIVGTNLYDLVNPNNAKQLIASDQQLIALKHEITHEEFGIRENGEPGIYLSSKTPIIDENGNVQGILGISFDITDRKKMEEKLRVARLKAEAANKAKSEFLATISHELRTPLTSILGFANLLEQATLPIEKKKEYNKHIIHSGAYLLTLINNLLDFNKLETKKFRLINMPIMLKPFIEEIITMLSGIAKLKNLDLFLDYQENDSLQIISDAHVLRQILINLVGNAIKFTEKGHVIIRVSYLNETSDATVVKIAIEDTGIGILPTEKKAIFKRFYQSDKIYQRNSSLTGTGLGLAIVKKLLALLQGEIYVESEPNKGSIFSFITRFRKFISTDSAWFPYASSVKILVIQDNLTKNTINDLLINTIYNTVNSKTAINELFSTQQINQSYDIVMIDEKLLRTTPNSLLQHIRSLHNLHQPLSILLTSETINHEKKATHPLFNDIFSRNDIETNAFLSQLKSAWENWQNQVKQPAPATFITPRYRTLLIEDDPLIQIVHKHLLEDLGCQVEVTGSAKDAFEYLKNPYDLLFTDIGLPDIDGFELIKTIRKKFQNHINTPIIVLTGFSDEKERRQCLRAGANEVATKPVARTTLSSILNRYLLF